jgi:hypothetical protein
MDLITYAIIKKLLKKGGGTITVDSSLSNSSTNPVQNKVINTALGGKTDTPTVETVTGATPSITAAANTIYKCGEIASLTISSFPATGDFTVIFTSGSTPTTFTEPSGMVMPDGFSVEANTRYEINVSDGYAVVGSWVVSADA